MHYIQPFVEKLLAGAIALRELLKAINIANGYQYEKFGKGGFFGEIEDSATNAEEAIDSLKRNLLGFDKLNVLGTSTGTGDTNYSFLLDQIKKYASGLEEVENKANKISESILTWAGFTYNAETKVWEFSSTIENVLFKVIDLCIEKIFSLSNKVVEIIDNVLPKILEKLPYYIELLVGSILDELPKLVNSIWEFVKNLFSNLSGLMENLKETIKNTTPQLVEFLMGFIAQVIEDLPNILIDLSKAILELTPFILETIDVLLASIIENLPTFISSLLGGIADNLPTVVKFLLDSVASLMNYLTEYLSKPEAITSLIDNVINILGSIISGVIEMIPSLIKGLGNAIMSILGNIFGDGLESLINGAIGILNTITQTISNAWTWTGAPGIPEIPKVDFANYIPALASGGVITQPTTALVGEYAGASSNPEIVTPENLMREVFIESMLPIAQAIVSGDREVVNAIQDLANRPVELNGRKVSENIYNDLQKVAMRKGHTMFASTR